MLASVGIVLDLNLNVDRINSQLVDLHQRESSAYDQLLHFALNVVVRPMQIKKQVHRYVKQRMWMTTSLTQIYAVTYTGVKDAKRYC